ncbi:hypothetical protein [Streptomyces sp. NPDC018352]|uniref:hypothetical protein n=1 Tax=Streptomyces sp. NPDC018352 TaxID=3157194 RepID=UPI0033C0B804
MPSAKTLRDLPPHLRLLAWPALNHQPDLPGVTVRVPTELSSLPPSLACSSSDVTIAMEPTTHATSPEDLLTAPQTAPALAEPMRLVSTLALWDEVVRENGVYPGNIYLASEQSVALLLHTAHGTGTPATAEPSATARLAELLEQMHALELLYRFPVAYKFRGAHGAERQCRINGWGRLIFRMLTAAPADPYNIAAARARLTGHVQAHQDAYRRGVAAARAAEDGSGARIWSDIHTEQPIPVLI